MSEIELSKLYRVDIRDQDVGRYVLCYLFLRDYLFIGTYGPDSLIKYEIDENGLFKYDRNFPFEGEVWSICKYGDNFLFQGGFFQIYFCEVSSGSYRELCQTRSRVRSLACFREFFYVLTEDMNSLKYSFSGDLESEFRFETLYSEIFVNNEYLVLKNIEYSFEKIKILVTDIYSKDCGLVIPRIVGSFLDEACIQIDNSYLYLTTIDSLVIRKRSEPFEEIHRFYLGEIALSIVELKEGGFVVLCPDKIFLVRNGESLFFLIGKPEKYLTFLATKFKLHIMKHPLGGDLIAAPSNYGVVFSIISSPSKEFNQADNVPFGSYLICNSVLPPPQYITRVYSLKLSGIKDFSPLSNARLLGKLDVRDIGLTAPEMASLCSAIMDLPYLWELKVQGNEFDWSLVLLKHRRGREFELDLQLITKKLITKNDAEQYLVKHTNRLMVVLLGHSGAGKTVFANYIRTRRLQAPGGHDSSTTISLADANAPAIWDFPGQIQSFVTNKVFLSNPFFVPVLVSDLSLPYDELLACQLFWASVLVWTLENESFESESSFETTTTTWEFAATDFERDSESESESESGVIERDMLRVPEIVLVGTHIDECYDSENQMEKMERLRNDLVAFCANCSHLNFDIEVFPICAVEVVDKRPSQCRLQRLVDHLSSVSVQESMIPLDWKNSQHRFRKHAKKEGLVTTQRRLVEILFKKRLPEADLLTDVLVFLMASGDLIFSKDLGENVIVDPIKFGEILSLFVAPVDARNGASKTFAETAIENEGKISNANLLGMVFHTVKNPDDGNSVTLAFKEGITVAVAMLENMGMIFVKEEYLLCPALRMEPEGWDFSILLDRFCYEHLGGIYRNVFGQCVSCGQRKQSDVTFEQITNHGSFLENALEMMGQTVRVSIDDTGARCFPPGMFEEFVKEAVQNVQHCLHYRNVVVFSKDDCVILIQLESFFMRHIYIICYSKSLKNAKKMTRKLKKLLERKCGEDKVFTGCLCPTCIDMSPLQSPGTQRRCCNYDDPFNCNNFCKVTSLNAPVRLKEYRHPKGENAIDALLAVTPIANSMINLISRGSDVVSQLDFLTVGLGFVSITPSKIMTNRLEMISKRAGELVASVEKGCENDKKLKSLLKMAQSVQEYIKTAKSDILKPGFGHVASRGYFQSLHYLEHDLAEVNFLIGRYRGPSIKRGKNWFQLIGDGQFREAFRPHIWNRGFRSYGCDHFEKELERLEERLGKSAQQFKDWTTREGLKVITDKLTIIMESQRRMERKLELVDEKVDSLAKMMEKEG